MADLKAHPPEWLKVVLPVAVTVLLGAPTLALTWANYRNVVREKRLDVIPRIGIALNPDMSSTRASVVSVSNNGGVDVDSVRVRAIGFANYPADNNYSAAGYMGSKDVYFAELPRGKTLEAPIEPSRWLAELRASQGARASSDFLFTVRVEARVLRKADANEFTSCSVFVLDKEGKRFDQDSHYLYSIGALKDLDWTASDVRAVEDKIERVFGRCRELQ